MIAGGESGLYRAALGAPHELVHRVDVLDGSGAVIYQGLPITTGKVSATLTSRVTRTLDVSLSAHWYPWEVADLLGPRGNRLAAYRGIRYGDGTPVLFPVFTGRIGRVSLREDNSISVKAVDNAFDVLTAGFQVPENSIAGASVTDEYQRLVSEGVPGAVFGPSDHIGEPVPAVTWESDRAAACDDVAAVGGALWYALAGGAYVIREAPWARVQATPDVVLSDGPGGIVRRGLPDLIGDGAYNGVTVVSERTDGSPPSRWTARDLDPDSPTWWFGNFGQRHKLIKLQTAYSQPQVKIAAEAALAASRSIAPSWSLAVVPDASLELGDLVEIEAKGHTDRQVIVTIGLPLVAGADMTVTTRAHTPGMA